MTSATHRWAALLLLALASPMALAQSLGDEFIFFVNGTNVMVPLSDAEAVNDPKDPTSGNKVAKFTNGSWVHAGFQWDRAEGIDATSFVGDEYGESDTLYFRMLSDPANAGVPGISIMLSDATDDAGVSRADREAGTADADNEFRLLWQIPDSLHDGMWHEFAIPLPPATWEALEAARDNGELMDGAENWAYTGSWTAGAGAGYGIGGLGGYDPPTSDPLWREFGWDQLYRIGPYWDNNQASAPIWLDDVYIGGPSTDISAATDPPSAMSGVTFSADGPINVVSWSASSDFGGYNVYVSEEPITDVDAEGVVLLSTVGFGEDTEVEHRYEIPHPSMGAVPIYYAVTSLSPFGVENPDVAASSGQVANENLAQKPYIPQLTDDQADTVFDYIAAGTVSDDFFSDGHPVFHIDSSHRSPGDGTSAANLPEDSDLSAAIKIGYTNFEELVIYGEITDDMVVFAPESQTGANTWNYDSAELSFGNYDVRSVPGGGILVGTPNPGGAGTLKRGEFAEYGLRITGLLNNDSGEFQRSSTWIGFSLDTDQPWSVVEETDTGWRFLSLINLQQIQADGDEYVAVPESDEIMYLPLALSLNDADATGTRENQIVWMIKPNVSGQWWNMSNQWETVAMAGATAVAAEDGTPNDGFALGQSAPNPSAGLAEITFTLGAPRHATVEVFNMLGQRVLVAADGEFGTGSHEVAIDTRGLASGVYVYRLSAGDYVAARRMTVVR